jgi:hypothetical protein
MGKPPPFSSICSGAVAPHLDASMASREQGDRRMRAGRVPRPFAGILAASSPCDGNERTRGGQDEGGDGRGVEGDERGVEQDHLPLQSEGPKERRGCEGQTRCAFPSELVDDLRQGRHLVSACHPPKFRIPGAKAGGSLASLPDPLLAPLCRRHVLAGGCLECEFSNARRRGMPKRARRGMPKRDATATALLASQYCAEPAAARGLTPCPHAHAHAARFMPCCIIAFRPAAAALTRGSSKLAHVLDPCYLSQVLSRLLATHASSPPHKTDL